MKFTRDSRNPLTIRRVEPGVIRIGDNDYRRTVGLTAATVVDMPTPSFEQLAIDDLEPLLESTPEILLLGTGWTQRQPGRELVFGMARRGIGLEVMDTPAACRTFNILLAEERKIAALLVID